MERHHTQPATMPHSARHEFFLPLYFNEQVERITHFTATYPHNVANVVVPPIPGENDLPVSAMQEQVAPKRVFFRASGNHVAMFEFAPHLFPFLAEAHR